MKIAEFKKVIWDYSRRIEDSINTVCIPVIEGHGLTMLQARILIELQYNNCHTIGSLANSICVAGANISAMCKKLEAQGLLERVRKTEDERVVMVILTELGRQTVSKIDKAFDDMITQHIKDELEDGFDDIVKGVQKLNVILQRISNADEKII